MTTATARRANGRRTRDREAIIAPRPTAYGRALLRAIDRTNVVGPWELGPKLSDRYFKR